MLIYHGLCVHDVVNLYSNLSFRIDDKKICITASGTHKGHIYEGKTIDGKKKPSAETLLYIIVYKNFPDVNAVFHVHTINATLILRLLKDKVLLKDYELLKAFDGIDTHENVVGHLSKDFYLLCRLLYKP